LAIKITRYRILNLHLDISASTTDTSSLLTAVHHSSSSHTQLLIQQQTRLLYFRTSTFREILLYSVLVVLMWVRILLMIGYLSSLSSHFRNLHLSRYVLLISKLVYLVTSESLSIILSVSMRLGVNVYYVLG